jgi:NTE family protein
LEEPNPNTVYGSSGRAGAQVLASFLWDRVRNRRTNVAAEKNEVDLVFEGGGVKGIGLVGALSVLEARGYRPQNTAGTSAGAIVATLYAAGYTAAELHEIMQSLDYNRFKDETWEDRIPLAGQPLSLIEELGIYKGEDFLEWMREKLQAKGVRTFGDLVHPDYANEGLRYRYKVQVIASDLTQRSLLVLPKDAVKLGIDNPDELDVAEAVRMSMSIPIFFEPVRFANPQSHQEHLIVDGGVLSNFPVWLFDSEGQPEWPTFGLRLVEPDPKASLAKGLPPEAPRLRGIGAAIDYIKSLIHTMLEAHDRLYLEQDVYVRTIAIPTLGVQTTEFDLSREKAEELYESGRTAAERFLETWSFAGYVAEYRQGEEHSRRQEIAERLRLAAEES